MEAIRCGGGVYIAFIDSWSICPSVLLGTKYISGTEFHEPTNLKNCGLDNFL